MRSLFKHTLISLLGRDVAGSVTLKQIYEIALVKGKDDGFKNTDLKGICKCLIDSAHSMGIQIVNDRIEQDQQDPLIGDVAASAN